MFLLTIGVVLLLAASGALWLIARRDAQENAAASATDEWVVFVAVGLHTAAFGIGIGFLFAGLTGASL